MRGDADAMSKRRAILADGAIAVAIAATATALCVVTRLQRIFGNDGAMLVDWTFAPASAYTQYHNTLYLPAARAVAALGLDRLCGGAAEPTAIGHALSAVSVGALAALSYALARSLAASRVAALAGAALATLAPVTWFFGAAVEVHSLHGAIVAGVMLATLHLPWRQPTTATALLAALLVVPCMSHQTAPALAPGFLVLAAAAAARGGAPLAWPRLAGVAAALGAAVGLGHLLVQWRRGLGFWPDFGSVAATATTWRQPFAPDFVLREIALPLGTLLGVFVLAMACRRIDWRARVACAAFVVPMLGAIAWYGVREHGGFTLQATPALALATALWMDALRGEATRRESTRSEAPRPWRASAMAAIAALIAAQAALGWRDVRGFDAEGHSLRERRLRIEQFGGATARVVSCNDNAPLITHWLPQAIEWNLTKTLGGDPPLVAWLQGVQQQMLPFLATGPVLLERSYARRSDLPPCVVEGMAAVEAWLRRDCEVAEHDDPSWPLWVVKGR